MFRSLDFCLLLLCVDIVLSQGLIAPQLTESKHSSVIFENFEMTNVKRVDSLQYLPKRTDPVDKRDTEYWDADLQRAVVCSALYNVFNGTMEVPALNYSVCVSQGDVVLAHGNMNYQHDVVYNSLDGEYFVVFIQQNGTLDAAQTSVMGLRLDSTGTAIGYIIPIFTYYDDPHLKHNPVVVHNTMNNEYLVAFDYVTQGVDHDIGGTVLANDGTVIVQPFYIGTSYVIAGADDNPSVAYEAEANTYMVVYEHIDTTDPTSHLILASLYSDGYPLSVPILISAQDEDDKNPQLVYNYDLDYFYLVWEVSNSEEADIYAVALDHYGIPLFFPPDQVAGTEFQNGTNIRDHNAHITYSPAQQEYFLVYEIDLYGVDQGPTNIIGKRIDEYGFSIPGLIGIGVSANVPYNRNPSVIYSDGDNTYLVAYEAFSVGSSVATIRHTVVSADTFQVVSDFLVSPLDNNNYVPSISYSYENNTSIVIWNRGTPVTVTSSSSGIAITNPSFSDKHNVGAIVGGVLGATAGAALIGGIVYFIVKKRDASKNFSRMENMDDQEMR